MHPQNKKQHPQNVFFSIHPWLWLEDHWPRNALVLSRKSATTVGRAKSVRTMLPSVRRRTLLGFRSLSRKHQRDDVINMYFSKEFGIHCIINWLIGRLHAFQCSVCIQLLISPILRLHSHLLHSTHDWRPNSLSYPIPLPLLCHHTSSIITDCKPTLSPQLDFPDFDLAPKREAWLLQTWFVLYSSIYIAPLNSHRQTEALLVRLAPRKETSFKKW